MNAMTASRQQVALVTGAAKRIGRVIALALARDGWDIAVHYGQSREEALALVAEITALGRRAVALQCELADEAGVRALIGQAAQLGPLGCVVNNASLFRNDQADNFTMGALDLHMRANVAAPVLLAQGLYDITPAGRQAVVINLLDQKLYNPNPDFLSYTYPRRRCKAPPPCWRRRWRRACGWWAWRRASRWCRATRARRRSKKPIGSRRWARAARRTMSPPRFALLPRRRRLPAPRSWSMAASI